MYSQTHKATEAESQPANYRRVAILKPGEFVDRSGQPAAFSAADLARIAESYDPLYHSAPVNIDHAEHGPALGVVGDLVFDGEHLLADLTNVPSPVAADLDAGRYPFRSAEIYRDLEGRGPYLRAVALLGARPPAVKGLPPLPARERPKPSQAGQAPQPARGAALQQGKRKEPQIIHILTEVCMPTNNDESAVAAAKPAGAETAAPAEPDAVRLAEENRRLAKENRRLRRGELQRDVDCFLEGLRRRGQLTPAMELAGVEEALLLSEEQPATVELADGRQLSLGSLLREVLSALPVCCPATAAAYSAVAGNGASGAPVSLSEDERDIARQLGLSEDEFREIKGQA